MGQTRRRFVGNAVALGALTAAAGRVRAQGHPVRRSLADFSRDAASVASLREGVAVMKARTPSDPRSWFFQAAIHAYNDALYGDALARDAAVAQVDAQRFWNKCPHFGQSSADFLIWHRAYLYNFEQILRDAAGDAMLALPYWDYSKPENRGFPAIFANPFLDATRQTPNPLYHPNREKAFVTGRFDISADVGLANDSMAAANFFSDIGEAGFGGDILDTQHTQLGLIEQRPHNDIHIAVGGSIGNVNGAMADIPTAAFDPVFWVHHANIDRLWAEWSCMPGKGWGPLPPDSWLDEEPWEFLDMGGTARRASRRFFLDRSNIAVFYDTDRMHGPPMLLPQRAVMSEAPPPPPESNALAGADRAAMPPMAMAAAPRKKATETELVSDARPIVASPKNSVARALAQPPVTSIESVVESAQARKPLGAAIALRRVLLELSDIHFAHTPSSGFAVYLASASDTENHSKGTFVGLIDLFGATHGHVRGMAGMGAVQRFDVTRIVARAGLALILHVEPYDLLVSKSGTAAPQRSDAITIGKVRFVEVS